MWNPPGPRSEPVTPVLAGRFLTTGPLGKPPLHVFNLDFFFVLNIIGCTKSSHFQYSCCIFQLQIFCLVPIYNFYLLPLTCSYAVFLIAFSSFSMFSFSSFSIFKEVILKSLSSMSDACVYRGWFLLPFSFFDCAMFFCFFVELVLLKIGHLKKQPHL